MPMFKVYVGNLDPRTTLETLKPYFDPFGEAVDEIILALDAEGQPRGFAIVLFRDPQLGQLAIETLTGKRINGREVQINEAVKKGKRTQPSEKAPRNSPLGPRAFQRPGQAGPRPGFSRPTGSRPSGFGSRPAGDRPGFGGASAGGAGRFSRNPRRMPGAPGAGPLGGPDAGGTGATPSPGTPLPPGSRVLGGGAGVPRPTSRPLGSGAPIRPASPRPPMPGGSAGAGPTSRPLGSSSSRPLGPGSSPAPRPAAPSVAKPPVPPAGTKPPAAEAPAADAPPPRPRAVKKKPPPET